MLATRIVTAILLMAVLVPTLALDSIWPFAALTLIVMATAGWEWARLNGAGGASIAWGAGLGIACAIALAAGWGAQAPQAIWIAAMLAWVIGGTWVLRRGIGGWAVLPRGPRIAIGMLALWVAWLALANAKAVGLNFILSVLVVVWAADVFAYFGGRAFGRRRLSPAISPGKSWEGAWSGLAGAWVTAAVWWWVIDPASGDGPSLFGRIASAHGLVPMVLAVAFLVAVSIVGDLFESLVKRSAGAKDSSRLLPGHGGVLDRIDALLPAVPIALALASW